MAAATALICATFGSRFGIDLTNARGKRGADISGAFPNAGKDDIACRNASCKGACQFASRHNISTGTATRQKRNHTQGGIGL
jgi:hypothetical protein